LNNLPYHHWTLLRGCHIVLGLGPAEMQGFLFFERSKSSGVPVSQPNGRGGESNNFKSHPDSKKVTVII